MISETKLTELNSLKIKVAYNVVKASSLKREGLAGRNPSEFRDVGPLSDIKQDAYKLS